MISSDPIEFAQLTVRQGARDIYPSARRAVESLEEMSHDEARQIHQIAHRPV
jgi:hypothetical protein